MKRQIIKFSTNKIIVDLSIVLFYLKIADEILLNEEYSPDVFYLFKEFINKAAELIYERENIICPECGHEMIKNGRSPRKINKNLKIYYQTYCCNKENKGCKKIISASDEKI